MEIVTRKEAKVLGFKHYFTGKPCLQGHISYRYTSIASCVDCKKYELIKARQTNQEFLKAGKEYSLKYSAKNRERLRKLKRDRYSSDSEYRESEKQRHKEYYRTTQGKESKIKARNKYRALKINSKAKCLNKKLTGEFYFNCPNGYEVDHIIPLSKGGIHDISNLQYLTKAQNISKKNRHYAEIGMPIVCLPCDPNI